MTRGGFVAVLSCPDSYNDCQLLFHDVAPSFLYSLAQQCYDRSATGTSP